MGGRTIRKQSRPDIVVPSAAGVAERWRETYGKHGTWGRLAAGDSHVIHEALCDLGADPNPDAVAKIVGNKSWTHPRCDGCNEECDLVVVFADSWNESKPSLCRGCIDAAHKLLATSPPEASPAEPE